MIEFLAQPFFQRLALTLLHFLWQGAVVAVLLGAALQRCSPGDARRRYAVSLVAFVLLLLCPIVTFLLVSLPERAEPPQWGEDASLRVRSDEPADLQVFHYVPAHPSIAVAAPTMPRLPSPLRDATAGDAKAGPEQGSRPREAVFEVSESSPWGKEGSVSSGVGQGEERLSGKHSVREEGGTVARSRWALSKRVLVPWCILSWMTGTVLLGLRLLLGFVGIVRLKRRRDRPPEFLQEIADVLGRRLQLRGRPRVFLSSRVRDALVAGFFRPVVLLPLCWCTQLPPDVLRSVVAHELAHIRRWDQWVNLLQRLAEVVLFYHPAVWWISACVRREREFCCDKLAAAVVGGPLCYAEALERVAHHFTGPRGWLLANTLGGRKMKMLDRVRHILGLAPSPDSRGWWSAGLLAVCLPLALCAAAVWWNSAAAEDGVRRDRRPERRAADRREGDRREGEADRRDRDRREDAERRERRRREEAERREREERRRRGPEGRFGPRDGRPPHGNREADRRSPGPPELRELLELVRDLRHEVRELRREVNELKRHVPHGPPHRFEGERDRRPPARRPERDFDRRPPAERDRDRADRRRPEGDRPGFRRVRDRRESRISGPGPAVYGSPGFRRERDRREGNRDRRQGDRREGFRRDGDRRDAQPGEGDRREGDRRQKPETKKERAGDGEG